MPGVGWAHLDGKFCRTKKVIDRRTGEEIEVDDHCVLVVDEPIESGE